jgi:hypothetical protein
MYCIALWLNAVRAYTVQVLLSNMALEIIFQDLIEQFPLNCLVLSNSWPTSYNVLMRASSVSFTLTPSASLLGPRSSHLFIYQSHIQIQLNRLR